MNEPDLVGDEGNPQQGRHVARPEHFGDEAADQRNDAKPQHPHHGREHDDAGRRRRHEKNAVSTTERVI